MTELFKKRPVAIRTVLPFVFTHWMRQPWLCAGIAASMLGATMADIFMPLFAGRLVDAVTTGISDAVAPRRVRRVRLDDRARPGPPVDAPVRVLRHHPVHAEDDVGHRAEAFHRVQRFSTDWHANTFAGSTVRKVTRGMWALDLLNDTLLIALLPSLVGAGRAR